MTSSGGGSRLAHQPRQRRQNLRQVPRWHRGTYLKSVHGQLLAKGDQRGPVCTDCHTAHQIEKRRGTTSGHQRSALRQMSRGPAGALPGHLPRQAMALGKPNAAPPWPPAMTVTAITTCCRRPTRRRTCRNQHPRHCQQCHPGATIGFTEFKPHANPLDANISAAPRRFFWP